MYDVWFHFHRYMHKTGEGSLIIIKAMFHSLAQNTKLKLTASDIYNNMLIAASHQGHYRASILCWQIRCLCN